MNTHTVFHGRPMNGMTPGQVRDFTIALARFSNIRARARKSERACAVPSLVWTGPQWEEPYRNKLKGYIGVMCWNANASAMETQVSFPILMQENNLSKTRILPVKSIGEVDMDNLFSNLYLEQRPRLKDRSWGFVGMPFDEAGLYEFIEFEILLARLYQGYELITAMLP